MWTSNSLYRFIAMITESVGRASAGLALGALLIVSSASGVAAQPGRLWHDFATCSGAFYVGHTDAPNHWYIIGRTPPLPTLSDTSGSVTGNWQWRCEAGSDFGRPNRIFCPVGTTELRFIVISSDAYEIDCFGSSRDRVVRIQQVSSNLYVDAHEQDHDYALVLRERQGNDSQLWVLTDFGQNTYTIYQASSRRNVDAHVTQAEDYRIVTRDPQINNTQRWILMDLGGGTYTIRQVSTGRLFDAHEDAGHDFGLVTRSDDNDSTQRWRITPQ